MDNESSATNGFSAAHTPPAPPAPPPMPPGLAGRNPYDFITNPNRPNKKRLLPGTNSKKGQIIIAVGGATILLMIILIFVGLISGGSSDLKKDYLSLAQQQAELIRVTEIGVSKSRQAEAKNLAITTQYTLVSQQPEVLALAKKAGVVTNTKLLALNKNSETDALLANADQTNQFDEVFLKTLRAELQKYQQTLKKIYDDSSLTSTKTTLSKDYDAIDVLLGNK